MIQHYDAVVIGGGFYGCAIAVFLSEHLDRVLVIEREVQLLGRASYVNQARLHTGYHYPRSFRTAVSSVQNLGAFKEIYQESVDSSFRALYAIAKTGSKVNRGYFERFCRELHLPLKPAPKALARLFSPRLIDGIYECEEYAFDAGVLRRILERRLAAAGVEVRTGTTATGLKTATSTGARATVELEGGEPVTATWVFNCTYASVNHLRAQDRAWGPRLKHQVTEVCLVEVPDILRQLGVTVMDGPFFSTMPFPDRRLHSLTHVRYTPHFTWIEAEQPNLVPNEVLARHAKRSRFPWMLRDAQRYLPALAGTRPVEALFEIKTVLVDTDVDDARPIAFYRDRTNPRVISVLGGKIDNIFDVLEVIRRELEFAS